MKIGIALSGGGAKGFAHIGVLNALDRAGIEIDAVSGTSMGALVGAFYASGKLEELQERASGIRLRDIPLLLSLTISKQGLFSGRNIEKFLSEFLGGEKIERLNRKYAAVCIDLNKGNVITFTKGDLVQAVRASIAIPGVFKPVISKDELLVDGGIIEPLPVHAARDIGSDYVIAVDVISDSINYSIFKENKLGPMQSTINSGLTTLYKYVASATKINSDKAKDNEEDMLVSDTIGIISIIQRSILINQRKLITKDLLEYPADFIIRPELASLGVSDFHRAKQIIDIGEHAAVQVIKELKAKIRKAIRVIN